MSTEQPNDPKPPATRILLATQWLQATWWILWLALPRADWSPIMIALFSAVGVVWSVVAFGVGVGHATGMGTAKFADTPLRAGVFCCIGALLFLGGWGSRVYFFLTEEPTINLIGMMFPFGGTLCAVILILTGATILGGHSRGSNSDSSNFSTFS